MQYSVQSKEAASWSGRRGTYLSLEQYGIKLVTNASFCLEIPEEGLTLRVDEPPLAGDDRDDCPKLTLFLLDLYKLSKAKASSLAIGSVIDFVETLLETNIEECDRLLKLVDVDRLMASIQLAFLSMTYVVKDRLLNRDGLYHEIKQKLVEQRGNAEADKLLAGLQ